MMLAFLTGMYSYGQTLKNKVFLDFGPAATNGEPTGQVTTGSYQNFWNDINSPAVTSASIVLNNSANTATNFRFDITRQASLTTATSIAGGGGLLAPDETLLGEFAVKTATEDYFFNGSGGFAFKFSGLNPSYTYVFKFYSSRTATDTRTGRFTFTGSQAYVYTQTSSGTGVGANSYNGNNNTVTSTVHITPDANGVIALDVVSATANSVYLNALKIEEYEPATMPVKLKAFQGKSTNNGHLLTWDTESEINVNHFDIERRNGNDQFEKIGEVGAGKYSYSFLAKESAGISYYRLKMVDNDGTFDYSGILSVKGLSSGAVISFYPNPVIEELKIESKDTILEVGLRNVDGKLVKKNIYKQQSVELDMGGFGPGVYFVTVRTVSGITSNKIIKK